MADMDRIGAIMWRVSRMRDLQKRGEDLRPWEATDLLLLEREVDELVGAYFLEDLMPEPPDVKGAPKT